MLSVGSLISRLARGFATKLQASSTRNTKDSAGRRLGVKKFTGEYVYPNDIVIRQRGFKWKAGHNTLYGRDHTIHATCEGHIRFTKRYVNGRKITTIHVVPQQVANTKFRRVRPHVYHPELYPDLAKFNPTPTRFPIKPRKRRPVVPKVPDYPVRSRLATHAFAITPPAGWVVRPEAMTRLTPADTSETVVERLLDARNRVIKAHINRK